MGSSKLLDRRDICLGRAKSAVEFIRGHSRRIWVLDNLLNDATQLVCVLPAQTERNIDGHLRIALARNERWW
jgi:hypothetical protein